VTNAPPELVRVSVSDLLFPTRTVPNVAVAGLATRAPGTKPMAVSGRFKVEFAPLLTRVKLPLTLPPACGANVVVKLALWPGANVSGKLRPLTLKPAPAIEACEMVRLDPPELIRLPAKVLLEPSKTLPKSKLAGLAVSCPAATPVPERERPRLGFAALLAKVKLPVVVPIASGVKLRFTVVL